MASNGIGTAVPGGRVAVQAAWYGRLGAVRAVSRGRGAVRALRYGYGRRGAVSHHIPNSCASFVWSDARNSSRLL
jgi:hypothetical protein